MKRSQAALEFLMTYGWAFMVILVMIAVLAYFGVLDPTKLLPERCVAGAGFECTEFTIYQWDADPNLYFIIIEFENQIGQAITFHGNDATLTGDFVLGGSQTDDFYILSRKYISLYSIVTFHMHFLPCK